MKANEAPESIYLLPDDRNPDGLSICWYEAPYRTGAVEYTRTDAFIDKACESYCKICRIQGCKCGGGDKDCIWLKMFKQAMKE